MPSENPPAFLPATSVSPTRCSTSSTRDSWASRWTPPSTAGGRAPSGSGAPTSRRAARPPSAAAAAGRVRLAVDQRAARRWGGPARGSSAWSSICLHRSGRGSRSPCPACTVNVRSSTAFVAPKCLCQSPHFDHDAKVCRNLRPARIGRRSTRDSGHLVPLRTAGQTPTDPGYDDACAQNRFGMRPAWRASVTRAHGVGASPTPSGRLLRPGHSRGQQHGIAAEFHREGRVASGADAGVEDHGHPRTRRRSSRCCAGSRCRARCRSANPAASRPRTRRPRACGPAPGRRWCTAGR